MMVHSCRADTKSSCGGGGGPLLLFESEREGLPWESREVEEALSFLSRFTERESVDVRGEPDDGFRCIEGRISFFCLEAGRISSRSTGTPRDTRKSLRIRDRIQLGGWSGGGATNCDQREALRGVRNIGFSAFRGGRTEVSIVSGGKRAFIYGSVAAKISSDESRVAKSKTG